MSLFLYFTETSASIALFHGADCLFLSILRWTHDDNCLYFSFTMSRVFISLTRCPVSPFLCHGDQCLHFYLTMTRISVFLLRCPVSPFLFHDDQGLHFFISRWPGSPCLFISQCPVSPFLFHDDQGLHFSFTMSSVSISHSRRPVSPFLFTMTSVSISI